MELADINIKIVVPCFNETERLDIGAFRKFLEDEKNKRVSFLFVDDGSKDQTLKKLEDLSISYKSVGCMSLPKNVGKAEAVRLGVLESLKDKADYIGFLDADLSTPLEEVYRMALYTIKLDSPCLIMGSRVKLLGFSNIKRKASRHYLGRVFATVVSNLLGLAVYDTQCGAKLIRSDLLEDLFKKPFISKWLFDVEIIFRLKQLKVDNEKAIVEVPLKEWEHKSGSKIKLGYYFQAPFDLLRIYFKYS